MSFSDKEASVAGGAPVNLFLFSGSPRPVEAQVGAIAFAPGASEFGYGSTFVRAENSDPENFKSHVGITDFGASIADMTSTFANLNSATVPVTWYGDDLRLWKCQCKPRVVEAVNDTTPYNWRVGNTTRDEAEVVSRINGKPFSAGTPSDRSLYEGIRRLIERGLGVTVAPLLELDIAPGNAKGNPYGGTGQPEYPWRGDMTCMPAPGEVGTVDQTADAATQMSDFFGTVTATHFGWNAEALRVTYTGPDEEWSYRRYILHLATIAKAAGAEKFLIGSQMVGMTRVRSSASDYPGVTQLRNLASECRRILGSGVEISYAADWTEYHSHQPYDGTGDVRFNMDPLWGDSNINFVGIENFTPMSDWRDSEDHLDRLAGWESPHGSEYLRSNIEGGEHYDWVYASQGDRDDQIRSPITDPTWSEPWVFRLKDFRNWWESEHRNRPGGTRDTDATAWVPADKRIVFTSVGCPAVDKGTNAPDRLPIAGSSHSSLPHYSDGSRDDGLQRAALTAVYRYWSENTPSINDRKMLDVSEMALRSWDTRPYPSFPREIRTAGEVSDFETGYVLNGRTRAGDYFIADTLGPFAFTNAEYPIRKDGVVYRSIAIDVDAIEETGTLDKTSLRVRMERGTEIDDLILRFPPAQPLSLRIFQGHADSDPSEPGAFPARWAGRVLSASDDFNEIDLTCEPLITSLKRPGLRRNYQIRCPHVLYGPQCGASRKAATVVREVQEAGGTRIRIDAPLPKSGDRYVGGTVEWRAPDGAHELRAVKSVSDDRLVIGIRGPVGEMPTGTKVQVTLGCAKSTYACREIHNNILNFGGQPGIPRDNPLSSKNVFY